MALATQTATFNTALITPLGTQTAEKVAETEPTEPIATVRRLDALDDIIHQKVRLGVMSSLMASGEADFNFLKAALGVSDGNLSTHLAVLEESGYVAVRKEFVGKKPRTTYTPTDLGRKAFEQYVEALEALVRRG